MNACLISSGRFGALHTASMWFWQGGWRHRSQGLTLRGASVSRFRAESERYGAASAPRCWGARKRQRCEIDESFAACRSRPDGDLVDGSVPGAEQTSPRAPISSPHVHNGKQVTPGHCRPLARRKKSQTPPPFRPPQRYVQQGSTNPEQATRQDTSVVHRIHTLPRPLENSRPKVTGYALASLARTDAAHTRARCATPRQRFAAAGMQLYLHAGTLPGAR